MITGSCHCGVITFSITESPGWLTECNCSICRRLGGLWGHVAINKVTIRQSGPCWRTGTIRYTHGDRMLAFHTCKSCGCTTHWENLQTDKYSHMAVNFRMCSKETIAEFTIRQFDGADTWKFLD